MARAPWSEWTLVHLIRRQAAELGDRPFVRFEDGQSFTFRALDAFRVFDLIYVLTGGGPGTATESVSLYTFSTLLQKLRFGYASALSVIVFAATFGLGLIYIRVAGRQLLRIER